MSTCSPAQSLPPNSAAHPDARTSVVLCKRHLARAVGCMPWFGPPAGAPPDAKDD